MSLLRLSLVISIWSIIFYSFFHSQINNYYFLAIPVFIIVVGVVFSIGSGSTSKSTSNKNEFAEAINQVLRVILSIIYFCVNNQIVGIFIILLVFAIIVRPDLVMLSIILLQKYLMDILFNTMTLALVIGVFMSIFIYSVKYFFVKKG